MGAGNLTYVTPITQKPDGESSIYRNSKHPQLLMRPQEEVKTVKDVYIWSAKRFANKGAQGRIIRGGQSGDRIEYTTYSELLESGTTIGSYLISEKKYYQPANQPYRFVGIFSKNMPQWGVVDVACALYNLTSIPIYDTLGDQNITYVLKHTNIQTCFVNAGAIKALMKTKDCVQLKTLISFEPISNDASQYFKNKGIEILSYQDIMKQWKTKEKVDFYLPEFNVKPENCFTFSYTSGTTGPPKGAMLSHGNFISFLVATDNHKDLAFNQNDVIVSYLPLPHIMERQFNLAIYYAGGTIVYYSGDVQKLKDDLALAKPTVFLSVPRLYSRFYDVIREKFNAVQGYQKVLLDHALNTKISNIMTSGSVYHTVYDKLLFAKTKQSLGGRVRIMISGSAPLLPDVQNFMKAVICAPLIEAYGQTQSTGGVFATDAIDPQAGVVGGPTVIYFILFYEITYQANCQYKLVDIPEMNYRSSDQNQQGENTPKGQIWIRGPCVFLGYYHDQEKTKEAITPDGWLKTGDVGMMLPNTQALKIIDRKKNIFKLQQGEYVAAQKVQGLLLKCPILAELFIHGESTQCFVIGFATVHQAKLVQLAESIGIKGQFQELCANKDVRSQLVAVLNDLGKKCGLQGFQQIKNINIIPETFLSKGILTNTMKIQRHEAKKLFSNEIKQMYAEGMLPTKKK